MPSVNRISEPNGSVNLSGPGKNVLFHSAVKSHLEVTSDFYFLSTNR